MAQLPGHLKVMIACMLTSSALARAKSGAAAVAAAALVVTVAALLLQTLHPAIATGLDPSKPHVSAQTP
jgi:hypothetical protein